MNCLNKYDNYASENYNTYLQFEIHSDAYALQEIDFKTTNIDKNIVN